MQTKKTDTSKSEKAAAMAGKTWTILKSETTAFVIGLLCVIFGVYLLLAFSSFFFTGGNDQSILSHPNPSELLETGNRIQNYAGARGAQLAQFLINDCFGFSAYCIIIFLVVAGMKLMKAYEFRIRYWFLGCATVMVWLSVTLGFAFGGLLEDSYIYPGGLHGYNVSLWIRSQIGAPGLILVLLATAILFGVALTRQTMGVVRKALHPQKGNNAAMTEEITPQPEPTYRYDPTLTFNTIGRHQSMLVRTRVASTGSPWLSHCDAGSEYEIAISHGEGRFVAPQNVLDQLVANGQVATQYVDLEGEPTMDQRYNPNGSLLAIEGITSPDGRVFGKMGHSERSGEYLYKNVTGDKYQPIFEGGVDYFKV